LEYQNYQRLRSSAWYLFGSDRVSWCKRYWE